MGNPVPLKLDQLFSENTIREIPESSKNTTPLPLKILYDFIEKLIRGFHLNLQIILPLHIFCIHIGFLWYDYSMRFLWCYPLFHLFILYWDSRFFIPYALSHWDYLFSFLFVVWGLSQERPKIFLSQAFIIINH